MKNWLLAFMLALLAPPLLAAQERVIDVLKDLQAHGYVSPSAAAARLQSARQDPQAPLEQRRRYYAELIDLSVPDKNTRLLAQAIGQLQRMAQRDHCKSCRAMGLIGKAREAILEHHLDRARSLLKQAAPLAGAGSLTQQLQLAEARVALARAQGASNVAFSQAHVELDLANQLESPAAQVEALIDLGVTNAQLGFPQRAAKIIAEAATQAHSIGYTAAVGLARLNQGYIYATLHQPQRQLHALQQSMAVSASVPGLAYIESIARADIADYYLSRKDWTRALENARAAVKLAAAHDDAYSESVALANVGIATVGMGHVDAGLVSLRQSLKLAHQAGSLRIEAEIGEQIVKTLASARRYREALDEMHAITGINREITKQERDTAVLELQAKYDDERKNRKIAQLSTEARLKEAEAAAQLWQQRLWATLATFAAVAVLLMVFWVLRARRANRRLVEDVASLTEQSSLDELTGAFNRRHFAALMQPYSDGRAQVGLVMLDIDHFKRINDSLGHDAGDAVLVEVARRLRSFVRNHDQVVRWGGEEFVLVLRDATSQGLPATARRLLAAVATSPIHVGQHPIDVSISAGCVVHPLEPGCPWEQSLRLADTAMYRAKRRGRNRAACVTTVKAPLQDVADGGLAAMMRSDMTVVTEVVGPLAKAAS